MDKPKVIITGASGFIGKNLMQFLSDHNFEVECVSLRANWQLPSLDNAIAIIHLAGKAHDTKNTSDASEYFKINTELTIELFDKYVNSTCRDFFYFSSVKAVADEVKDILYDDVIPDPKTSYGESKLQAEKHILNTHLQQDKRVFIVRPCMVHGPGNKGNLNLLYKVIKKGIPYPLAAFNNKRSFLSIDNLNYLVLQMLQKINVKSGVYNFADDDFVSTNTLVSIIGEGIGKKAVLLKIPKKLIGFVARMGDFFRLPLNSERLTKLTENYRVSNQKIKKELGITNLPVSANTGLLKTIKSFNK